MVGSGARESNAVQVGAIIPHRLTKTAHDFIIEMLPAGIDDDQSSESFISSVIDVADLVAAMHPRNWCSIANETKTCWIIKICKNIK